MKIPIARLLPACFLLTFPITAFSAEISVDSTTLVRFEQRDISGSAKKDIFPATQFLGLDADKLADGNLSFHFYGWGRADLGDRSYNNDKVDGSLTYGFLQYRFKEANADIRAGRLFVREGIVNEHIDGISAHTDLPFGFGVSVFGGANVHTTHLYGEKSDGKGDAIFGGRVNYRYKGLLELGVSGAYESKAPTLLTYSIDNHRLAGGDIWFSPHKMVEIIGHSSYNTETKRMAEHSYLLNLKPIQNLVLSGEFNEHHSLSYFGTSALFSSSQMKSYNPAERSRSLGGSASYQFNKTVELVADYKQYTRDMGNADRYGATVKLSLLNNALRSGIGYHYLRASQGFDIPGYTGSASYHELRGYAMHDTKTYFATFDLLGYLFKEKISNEKSAWVAAASLGYHITPALALSGDVSHGRNPEFTEETKGLIRLTYNMTFDGKGAKK
jgi:hypothetical protein